MWVCRRRVGLERQLRGKPAGIRTSILVCLGTSLFVSLGVEQAGQNADTTRVLGQVVTGVGFLGAGVIMTRERAVIGVTSAAVIWVLAGIGATAGFGHFVEAIALSVLTVILLGGIAFVEDAIPALRKGAHAAGEGEGQHPPPT